VRALRIAVVAACAAALVAGAASGAPRASRVQLGVAGNPAQFQALTGQRSTVRLIILAWNQGGSPGYFRSLFSTMLDEPMLGLGIPSGSGLTPAGVAHGQGDSWLVAINQAVAAWAKPIYVRPLAEMNGWWSSYSAYNQNGSRRGPAYSTAMYRKAFARIYLIVHGDPDANAKLARLGLPPVRGTLAPASNVQVIWNPQGYGSPDLPGNSAAAYYPGNAYVDVVGDDLYDQRFKAEWAAAAALYRAHPGKPFAFPEWGLWGIDDPTFVRTMGAFVRSHPRTVLTSYFNLQHGSTWDMSSKPRARAAFRRYIDPLAP
jgi:hypothetical protein